MVRHADNHRQGVVKFSNLQETKTGYRALQLRLLEVSNKEDMKETLRLRRQEIITCISGFGSVSCARGCTSRLKGGDRIRGGCTGRRIDKMMR